jgi:tartrate dehydrogenase/decarboxylase/D-malate dehydrogenase
VNRHHDIAVIAGDGIGPEVVSAAQAVLEAAALRFGFAFRWRAYEWGCDYFTSTGHMMPDDGLATLADHDAIFLGAVGRPDVPDHISLWELLIPIRRTFQQYVNLRPIHRLPGIPGPLRTTEDIDLVIVRENNEGEYSSIGGRIYAGTPDETVVQESVFTRRGVRRVIEYAFELAARRNGSVTSATKSNGIVHTMPFWDEIFAEVSSEHPAIVTAGYHIDALAAGLILAPGRFDVIVASNLFGDILSDLTAAIVGGIGLAPSANLDPSGRHPSMFEPVHGSAPDIAGRGIANPIGQIWSGSLMLDHLGHPEAGSAVLEAMHAVLRDGGPTTPDLGGTATTAEMAAAIADHVASGS